MKPLNDLANGGSFFMQNSLEQYTGRERSAVTGLQYNRWRIYDSGVGRWTTRDPIGYSESDMNLYGYVINRPYRFVDFHGLEGDECCVEKFDVKVGNKHKIWDIWNEKKTKIINIKVGVDVDVTAEFKDRECDCQAYCCEYRQYVKKRTATWQINGQNFVNKHKANDNGTPVEDAVGNIRMGHRGDSNRGNDKYSNPNTPLSPRYGGRNYNGHDEPGVTFPGGITATVSFDGNYMGRIIDVCNGKKIVEERTWNVKFDTIVAPKK